VCFGPEGSPVLSPMMRNGLHLLVVLALLGCSPSGNPSPLTIGPGADGPVEAVRELQVALAAGDFDGASSVAVPGQAALAALAEGATFSQVANALDQGDADVASNFWSGFAQGVGEVFAVGDSIESAGIQTESGIDFHLVSITGSSGSERRLVTRDLDGYRIDLFASFAVSLAERLISPVESLLSSANDDANRVLVELQTVVPSLAVAATEEGLPPDSVQEILQLIELITRVG
jgi:hypothetical protein